MTRGVFILVLLSCVILFAQTSSIPTTGWVQGQGYSTIGIPSGLIALILSGTCPVGWSEVSALNGKMLRGTLAANADVGTTGGNATITPAGTNGTATTSATSAGTPAGTNSATATSGNCAATNIAAGTGSTTACKATAPNLTVPAETFTGLAMSTHTHTVPAETFTGSPIDPSPPFTRVIFCSKI